MATHDTYVYRRRGGEIESKVVQVDSDNPKLPRGWYDSPDAVPPGGEEEGDGGTETPPPPPMAGNMDAATAHRIANLEQEVMTARELYERERAKVLDLEARLGGQGPVDVSGMPPLAESPGEARMKDILHRADPDEPPSTPAPARPAPRPGGRKG